MNLRETTRDIIGQVEAQTGFPVQVLDDRTLPTLATVRVAREGLPAHIVRYRPSDTQPPDYMICYQCGFILRLFANPPEERFEVGLPEQEEEQESISMILSDMDAEIVALETKLAKARLVKQGMMQELLTGRTRLV